MSALMQTRPKTLPRAKTGALAFDDDWPGVFIRGDDALALANVLETFVDHLNEGLSDAPVRSLIDLLRSCRVEIEGGLIHGL